MFSWKAGGEGLGEQQQMVHKLCVHDNLLQNNLCKILTKYILLSRMLDVVHLRPNTFSLVFSADERNYTFSVYLHMDSYEKTSHKTLKNF